MAFGRLWNCYRDKIGDVDDSASQCKSFEYKTKITWKTPEKHYDLRSPRPPQPLPNPDVSQPPRPPQAPQLWVPTLNVDVTIPLKYLSNFWSFLHLPLSNCKVELDLSWTKDCVLIEHHNNITEVKFVITSTKRYVRLVTLPINDN